ncbi:MAG: hypothetical protein ACI9UV_001902 [Algoriphagus sp.]|jgi:hypothetical protein
MRRLILIIGLTFGLQVSLNAQQNPYRAINKKLGILAVEPKVLWPFEMEGVEVESMDIKYEFPFQKDNSDLVFNFKNFEELKSSVFDLERVDRDALIKSFSAGMPQGFVEEFRKISAEDFCIMISDEEDENVREVYLLVGDQKTAELLYFVYSEGSSSLHSKLKIELNKTKH